MKEKTQHFFLIMFFFVMAFLMFLLGFLARQFVDFLGWWATESVEFYTIFGFGLGSFFLFCGIISLVGYFKRWYEPVRQPALYVKREFRTLIKCPVDGKFCPAKDHEARKKCPIYKCPLEE